MSSTHTKETGRITLHLDERLTISLAKPHGRNPSVYETINTYSDLLTEVDSLPITANAVAQPQSSFARSETPLLAPHQTWDGQEGFVHIQTLGQGGMGVVYEAQQRSLLREVAIKQLKQLSPELEAHLVREARLMGRLSHPNIPPVYTLRRDEAGYTEVVMKKIEGQTLLEWLGAEPMRGARLQEGMKHLIQVCYALEFAHNQGVVHRDIKAENIMLGRFHEVYLMDWGVALDLNTLTTAPHGVVGTPHHLAPEMLSGDPAHISSRTDVYLLGALLHLLLTGQPRHNASTLVDCFRLARKSTPHHYPQNVPKELGALCNQACAYDPQARIASAQAFREVIEEYLDLWEVRELVALAEELSKAYEKLLLSEEPDEKALWETSHQAKSAFDQALYLRPYLSDVTRSRDHLITLMLRRALSRKELLIARTLVRELSDTDQKVAFDRDLTHLIHQEEERQTSLAVLEYELDPHVTLEPRRLLVRILISSIFFAVGGVYLWLFWTQQTLSLSPIHGMLVGVFGVTPTLSFIFVLRQKLFVNTAGRHATLFIVFLMLALITHRLFSWQLGESLKSMMVSDILLLALGFSLSEPSLRHGRLLGLLGVLTTFGVYQSTPEVGATLFNVYALIFGLYIIIFWRKESVGEVVTLSERVREGAHTLNS